MKKIFFFLFFTIHLVSAQIKPLKFALAFNFDVKIFPQNEQIISQKFATELLKDLDKQMDSISKSKSKCMNYIGIDTKNANIICITNFYKKTNIPSYRYFIIDNLTKDTLESSFGGSVATITRNFPDEKEIIKPLSEKDISPMKEEFLFRTNVILELYFSNCENLLDYKEQKRHEKAVVFIAYPSITIDKKNKIILPVIDNIINNYLIAMQIRNEKYKGIREFIFLPYNKETKDIKPDITIQIQLVQDKTGNYELKGEFKGKDVNFTSPSGEEMTTSIKLNKKRIDNGDYTELVYKVNYFMNNFYTYNILL